VPFSVVIASCPRLPLITGQKYCLLNDAASVIITVVALKYLGSSLQDCVHFSLQHEDELKRTFKFLFSAVKLVFGMLLNLTQPVKFPKYLEPYLSNLSKALSS